MIIMKYVNILIYNIIIILLINEYSNNNNVFAQVMITIICILNNFIITL